MRVARVVKKMPEGLRAGSSLRTAKVAVSITMSRSSSRLEIHTSSPLGVNSMCRIARPGLRVRTTFMVGTSMTWTVSLCGKAKFTHTRRPDGSAITNTGWPCTAMAASCCQLRLSATSTSGCPMAGKKAWSPAMLQPRRCGIL